MSSTINRLALGAGISLAGGVLCALAMSTAAHADDSTQRPGGALGAVVDLPTQASDTAHDAVDGVPPRPEPSKPADEPKPTKAPKPDDSEPSQEPEPPAEDQPANEPVTDDQPTDPPVEVPPVEVPPVVVDPPPVVVDIPPVVIETPPVVIEPAPIPVPVPVPTVPAPIPTPPTGPITLPGSPATLPAIPVPAVPALPPLPALPILIGPTAAPNTIDPARPHDEQRAAAPVPLCTDDLDAIHVDLERITIPVNLRPHRKATATAGGPPCPGTPGTPNGPAITMLAVKPAPPTGEQLVAINAAGVYTRPVLHRLTQLRPRGDLPAGRTEHPEPGPA